MAILDTKLVLQQQTFESRTYQLLDRKVEGFVDKLKALKQTVEKLLSTEQFEYPIYSFNYGIAWKQLIGEERPYVRAELKRMLQTALTRDDRILEVDSFLFEFREDRCYCSFRVKSIYGELELRKEVLI